MVSMLTKMNSFGIICCNLNDLSNSANKLKLLKKYMHVQLDTSAKAGQMGLYVPDWFTLGFGMYRDQLVFLFFFLHSLQLKRLLSFWKILNIWRFFFDSEIANWINKNKNDKKKEKKNTD